MTDLRVVRATIMAFIIYIGGMSLWKLFIMPDMSWFVVVGGSIAFAIYAGFFKRRQLTR